MLSPKQQRRPLPCLLHKSFFNPLHLPNYPKINRLHVPGGKDINDPDGFICIHLPLWNLHPQIACHVSYYVFQIYRADPTGNYITFIYIDFILQCIGRDCILETVKYVYEIQCRGMWQLVGCAVCNVQCASPTMILNRAGVLYTIL